MAKAENTSVYDNRELSWLKFDERVLEESSDDTVPLMERLTFGAIFCKNLDEFFMVRVGSLVDSMLLGDKKRDGKTRLRPSEQLSKIYKRVARLIEKKDASFAKIERELEKYGVLRRSFKQLNKKQSDFIEEYYAYEIEPFINAFVIDKLHPFPFLEGKSLYAAVKLYSKSDSAIGMISCSERFDRVIFLPSDNGGIEYILVEDVICAMSPRQFENFRVEEKTIIRVTRSADIMADEKEGDGDFRETMSRLISSRKRLCPVRLQLSKNVSDIFKANLAQRLGLDEAQLFVEKAPLDVGYVFTLCKRLENRSELFFPKLSPRRSPAVDPSEPMFKQIEKKDILLSYPYESIDPFLRLLKESAADKDVLSIKMTLYRVADNSSVVKALCAAAENGKEVVVCVELRARFDEENNIFWSKVLEESGCRIMYGPHSLKVHSKLCLITKKTSRGYKSVTQIGTGNYNEKTAAAYTDLCLMTANDTIAKDAAEVFRALSLGEAPETAQALLVSPNCLQNRVLDMIDEQIELARAGAGGYVGAKMNGLTDKKIIDKLIEASQAGVKIDLIIRGISCLVAGVKGQTDNIRIISIVGRFLEHSRIYIFGEGEQQRIYISSADFMTRNTCRRVEVAAPIFDEGIRSRILAYFRMQLSDNVKARQQQSDSTYKRVANDLVKNDCQKTFYERAYSLEPTLSADGKGTSKKKHGFFAWLARIFGSKK